MSLRRYTIAVDGRPFVVDVEDAPDDRYRVSVDGQSFDVTLDGGELLAGAAATPNAPHPHRAAAAPRPMAAPRAVARPAGAGVLSAPMPGLILRVSVAAGSRVERGQDIAVLEAMKMENIIRAPMAGEVVELCVQPGDQVGHGQAIVRCGPTRRALEQRRQRRPAGPAAAGPGGPDAALAGDAGGGRAAAVAGYRQTL
jgi:biotin carboxyl carrier protein